MLSEHIPQADIHQHGITPSRWLCQHADRIKQGGTVLDVAAGYGRNARWLAEHGYRVEAVDRNADALKSLNGISGIHTRIADLENADWPYVSQQFDAVIVCRYLHRPLFQYLISSLAPQGLLIYETFMQGQESYGKPNNPDFLLQPDELVEAFGKDLNVLAFEQGELEKSPPAMLQRLCAIRM